MILSTTESRRLKNIRKILGVRAFIPRKMENGDLVWLQPYWVYHHALDMGWTMEGRVSRYTDQSDSYIVIINPRRQSSHTVAEILRGIL